VGPGSGSEPGLWRNNVDLHLHVDVNERETARGDSPRSQNVVGIDVSYSNQNASRVTVPPRFKVQFSREEIEARVAELGEEIGNWCQRVWDESHTDVLTIPVLRGGLFFFSDLVRKINCSIEIAPVRTVGYDPTTSGVQKDSVSVIADGLAVKGRVVLIVDDICETGKTLEVLEKTLLDNGAREVRTAVLIRRLLNRPTFVPCWVGFDYPGTEWFVGYGMDDGDRWRNLPSVYIIRRDA
jgi:hypoxanthine phosphoribosyltransferase